MTKLIQQGAEAKIFLNTLPKPTISKQRTPKGYRHPQLDMKIRKRRTKSEAKILIKAASFGANVPKMLESQKTINPHTGETIRDFSSLIIEYINGDKLSQTLNTYEEKFQFKIMQKLGKQTALLHQNNIIHGDLTTSNTIWKDNKVFIIDFGLGFTSTKQEDKAVDLHLIKQALEAKHFQNHEKLFENFCKGYIWQDSEKILERLKVVEKRGRYKH